MGVGEAYPTSAHAAPQVPVLHESGASFLYGNAPTRAKFRSCGALGRRALPARETGYEPSDAGGSPDRDALRRLAELRLDRPAVLSLYLGLDPSEFATPPARATATSSAGRE